MSGLLKINNCNNPQRYADLILVHGLDGDAKNTWQMKNQADSFWPGWLGEEFPDLGIWSLDYDAGALAWENTMSLVDRANQTLDLLDLDGIGQRPLAFICHSLGGLLTKQMLPFSLGIDEAGLEIHFRSDPAHRVFINTALRRRSRQLVEAYRLSYFGLGKRTGSASSAFA